MKLKTNDLVLITTGKDKGKSGKITKVFRKQEKIIVEKINQKVKHIKKSNNQAGQKITLEAPFAVSNAMLICPECKKATRVSYKIEEGKKKYRVCKKCEKKVDQDYVKKTIKKKK